MPLCATCLDVFEGGAGVDVVGGAFSPCEASSHLGACEAKELGYVDGHHEGRPTLWDDEQVPVGR